MAPSVFCFWLALLIITEGGSTLAPLYTATSDSESDPSDLSDDDDFVLPAMFSKRVIIHLDLDCFEAQVWIKEKRPELENLDVPIVVVNFDKIILVVNYTARLLGVQRGNGRRYLEKMKQKHPQLIAIPTGKLFGKQDCFTPQKRSDDILQVLLNYQKTLKDPNSIIIERSSKDEFYIDVTDLVKSRSMPVWFSSVLQPLPPKKVYQLWSTTKTHPNKEYNGKPTVIMEGRSSEICGQTLYHQILGDYPKSLAVQQAGETCLAHGASIALALIKLIKERTGFDASAGVGHNKLLAKLACDRNKPQGITIITDASMPRLSKKLDFKSIPGYGGKRGQDLLSYFSQKGQGVTTLHDILTLPREDLIEAFGAVGSKDEAYDAFDFIKKCRGNDDSIVTKRHFTDTINASINFRGTHSVRKWNDFKSRVMSLSRDLSNRIKYNIERWNRPPHSLVVKATMRKRSNVTPSGGDNNMKIDGFVDATAINGLIMEYIKTNNLEFRAIEDIKLTAGGFKVSTVDGVANLTEAQDRDSQSAASTPGASESESEEIEDKTMSIEFMGANRLETHDDLFEELENFSEEIARQIDFYIMTQRSCPSELVVNVSLFGGAGSKKQWTKDNRLYTGMHYVPDVETIHGFIFGYIRENRVNARKIKAVHATLTGIKEFFSEVTEFGLLPTTNGYIRCPYYFPDSDDD